MRLFDGVLYHTYGYTISYGHENQPATPPNATYHLTKCRLKFPIKSDIFVFNPVVTCLACLAMLT